MAYDPETPGGQVRLLLNDTDEDNEVFSDAEIGAFLALENNVVKLAAAQAIDTNADNEALASKVLKTPTVSTDGAKLADALHKRAAELRKQAADAGDDESSYGFEVIDFPTGHSYAELTEPPYYYGY